MPKFVTFVYKKYKTMLDIHDFTRFEEVETPFYFYDTDLFGRTVDELAALSGKYRIKVHYAVKANAEERLLRLLSARGFGADCVSANEAVLAAEHGFAPGSIMLAGVGKTDKEIRTSLELGIGCFNIESIPEMEVIDEIAGAMGLKAPVALRINPNIDPHTHKYITTGLEENKFGISRFEFDAALDKLNGCRNLDFKGLLFHIGSQITDVENVFGLESRCARELVSWFEEKGLKVKHIDLGGGLGVDYDDPDGHPVADFETWMKAVRSCFPMEEGYELHIEPGRSVVAQCGTLVTRVVYVKKGRTKNFVITDAGMNDLIRPALYGAYHKVENLTASYKRGDNTKDCVYDVVGPVCESSDVWGEGRILRQTRRGDLLAIRSAGAYGRTMASRYNQRDLAPAVYSDEI